MYIPLHWHSTFSFLEAIGKPKDIAKKAKELWFPAIAITDYNVIYGLIQFFQAWKAEEINAILWVEIGFVQNINNIGHLKQIWWLCLLAKEDKWYLNLLKLVTYASQEWVARRPKIDFQILEQYKEGLLCFSWGLESRIATMLANSEPIERVKEILQTLKTTIGEDNCFLEIIAQDESINPEIKKINNTILELSKDLNISCFVSNIYQYLMPNDKQTYELAMAIKDNVRISDPQHRAPKTQNHLMLEDEIRAICIKNWYSKDQIDSRIEMTEKIANRCHANIEMGMKLFPRYEVEEEVEEIYKKYKEDLIIEE